MSTMRRIDPLQRIMVRPLRALITSLSAAVLLFMLATTARATEDISLASFDGDYAGYIVDVGGKAPVLIIFQRQLALLASTVTYTVNPNGIGRAQIFQGDGLETEAWFVVTETSRVRGKYIADELFVVQSELDPLTGDVISGPLSRIPD